MKSDCLPHAWQIYDSDGSGELDKEEFVEVLKLAGGVLQLADRVQKLAGGVQKLAGGVQKLAGGVQKSQVGFRKLQVGVGERFIRPHHNQQPESGIFVAGRLATTLTVTAGLTLPWWCSSLQVGS